MKTRQPIGQLLTTDYGDIIAVFNPGGSVLASGGSWDNNIILWDVKTRQPIGQPLTGHKDTVTSVAFSPDGKTLAFSSDIDPTGAFYVYTIPVEGGKPFRLDATQSAWPNEIFWR